MFSQDLHKEAAMNCVDETYAEFRARVLGTGSEVQGVGGATDLSQLEHADISENELDDLIYQGYQGYQDEFSGEASRRRAVGMAKEDMAWREDY